MRRRRRLVTARRGGAGPSAESVLAAAAAPLSAAPSTFGFTQKSPHPTTRRSASHRHPPPDAAASSVAPPSGNAAPHRWAVAATNFAGDVLPGTPSPRTPARPSPRWTPSSPPPPLPTGACGDSSLGRSTSRRPFRGVLGVLCATQHARGPPAPGRPGFDESSATHATRASPDHGRALKGEQRGTPSGASTVSMSAKLGV